MAKVALVSSIDRHLRTAEKDSARRLVILHSPQTIVARGGNAIHTAASPTQVLQQQHPGHTGTRQPLLVQAVEPHALQLSCAPTGILHRESPDWSNLLAQRDVR
ncbi:hypothetical protein ElyMa_005595000 [Elysia marginata]|uniref:Uncharacterized protein n=1 Tax=Elysia marginata TaxID=1093978 RepID=A0AAV4F656_9GAST|nr:hypothetical protein ElyMa_005595000 [Elysia marginata]